MSLFNERYESLLRAVQQRLEDGDLSQARRAALQLLHDIDVQNRPVEETGGLLLYDLLHKHGNTRPEGILVRLLGFPDGAIRPIHTVDRPRQLAVLVREDGILRAYHWDRLVVTDCRYLPKEPA